MSRQLYLMDVPVQLRDGVAPGERADYTKFRTAAVPTYDVRLHSHILNVVHHDRDSAMILAERAYCEASAVRPAQVEADYPLEPIPLESCSDENREALYRGRVLKIREIRAELSG